MGKKVAIDWSGLEEFRATLPTYGAELDFKHEYYRFLHMGWDIVKARYILQKYPREKVTLQVADTMDTLGLPKEPLAGKMSLLYVNEKHIMDVNLEQPLILGRVTTQDTTHLVFMDGLHRVVKAYRTGVAILSAQILTVEEADACRVH